MSTVTETWDSQANVTSSISGDHAWSILVGTPSSFEVLSHRGRIIPNFDVAVCQCDDPVATIHHSATALISSGPGPVGWGGVLCRLSASPLNAYGFALCDNELRLVRFTAGTPAVIGGTTGLSIGAADSIGVQAVAGVIKGYKNLVEVVSYTDPSPLLAGTHFGLFAIFQTVDPFTNPELNIEQMVALDVAAGGASPLLLQLAARQDSRGA